MKLTYNRESSKEKWTIMQYLRDFDLMTAFAYALRESPTELSVENLLDIMGQLEEKGIYKPTSKKPQKGEKAEKNINTALFRSVQIAWYMFGYYDKNSNRRKQKKFVFSPLGNLLLDNIEDKAKTSKIFLTMLFSLAFRQQFSMMNRQFNLYPYRLLFQLLKDPRLEGKLYSDEATYLLMFTKTVDKQIYEDLVEDILEVRRMTPKAKYELFKQNEGVMALAIQEWKYACGMLQSANIVDWVVPKESIGSLAQGETTKRHAKNPTKRAYKMDYISVRSDIDAYLAKLLSNYSYDVIPYTVEEQESGFEKDIIFRLYNFYPTELLVELGMPTDKERKLTAMLTQVDIINEYAYNKYMDLTGTGFEYVLKDAFNLFADVEAEKIGGAGKTDIECLYIMPKAKKKFDVEAKSRNKKLSEINPRRLREHREAVKSKYTLIIAPSFALGVKADIEKEPAVLIESNVLSQYLYQYICAEAKRDSDSILISYKDLDEMVLDNLGKDLTPALREFIFEKYGHNCAV